MVHGHGQAGHGWSTGTQDAVFFVFYSFILTMSDNLPDLRFVYPGFRGNVSLPIQQILQVQLDNHSKRRLRPMFAPKRDQTQRLFYVKGELLRNRVADDVWKLIHDDTALGQLIRMPDVQEILDRLISGHHSMVEGHSNTTRYKPSLFATYADAVCVIWRRDVDATDNLREVVRVHSICPRGEACTEIARLQPLALHREHSLGRKLLKPHKPVVVDGIRSPRNFTPRDDYVEAAYTQRSAYLTCELLESILSDNGGRSLIHFPLALTGTEQRIIRRSLVEETILLQGGAGTGKTLCCIYAMLAALSSFVPFKCLFITTSAAACRSAQERYNGIAQSIDGVVAADDKNATKLSMVESFPRFATYREFILLVDAMLDIPFFSAEEERTAYLCESPTGTGGRAEALQHDFVRRVWPAISCASDKARFSPERVQVQFTTHIRGSYNALLCDTGFVQAPDEDLHRLFLAYKGYKRANNLYDHLDVVHHVHTQLLLEGTTPHVNRMYVDEVQDLTQAELAVLFRVTQKEQRHMFLTGDVLQAVGVDFRFSDVTTVQQSEASGLPDWWLTNHHIINASISNEQAQCNHRRSHKTKKWRAKRDTRLVTPIPSLKPRPGLLVHSTDTRVTHLRSHCFRCLRGVLQLANSVHDLLEHVCLDMVSLPEKPYAAEDGPRPVAIFYQHLGTVIRRVISSTMGLQSGNTIAFLFRNNDSKTAAMGATNVTETDSSAVFLTITESKGREFDVVVVVNFFCDSTFDRWNGLQQYTRSDRSLDWLRRQHTCTGDVFLPIDPDYGDQLHPTTTLETEGRDWRLQTELKHLFVAATRARREVILLEDRRGKRAEAMMQLWMRQQVMADPIREDWLIDRYLEHRGTPQHQHQQKNVDTPECDAPTWQWVAYCHEFARDVRRTHYAMAMAMTTTDRMDNTKWRMRQAVWRFRAGHFRYEAAECLEKLGEWRQAAEEWSMAIREDDNSTNSTNSTIQRAWAAWLQLGNHELATKFLQCHVEHLEWDDVCDWVVASRHNHKQASSAMAVEFGQHGLAGEWLLEDREYHRALVALEQVTRPHTHAVAHRLAQAYEGIRDARAAEMYIALDRPADAMRVLESHGRIDEAVALCTSAEAIGRCYHRCGRFLEAAVAFRDCSMLIDAAESFCNADRLSEASVSIMDAAMEAVGWDEQLRIARVMTQILNAGGILSVQHCWRTEDAVRFRLAGMDAWAAHCCAEGGWDFDTAAEDLLRAPLNLVTSWVAHNCVLLWAAIYLEDQGGDDGCPDDIVQITQCKFHTMCEFDNTVDTVWTRVLPLVTDRERLYRDLLDEYSIDALPLILRYNNRIPKCAPGTVDIRETPTRCLLVKAFTNMCRLHLFIYNDCHPSAEVLLTAPCSLHLMLQEVFVTMGGPSMYIEQMQSPDAELIDQLLLLEATYSQIRGTCACYTVSYLLVVAIIPQFHSRVLGVLNKDRYKAMLVCPYSLFFLRFTTIIIPPPPTLTTRPPSPR